MGPAQRLMTGTAIALMAAVGFVMGRSLLRPEQKLTQPISFNHALHTEAIDCDGCHEHFNESSHSGLPGLSTCLMCHEEAVGENLAEEEKIRTLAEAGNEHVFRKLFRLPDNVFYSHRLHVGVAGIECATCHGSIADTEEPPETPLVAVTMDWCIECHSERGVSDDCTRCHR